MAAKIARNPAVLVARVTPPEEELPPGKDYFTTLLPYYTTKVTVT